VAALVLALLEVRENANQVKACLEKFGHTVIVVSTFLKALDLLRSKNVDLILSDVHLENGGTVFDFLRHVKRGKNTYHIPFVLFSSKPTPLAKYLADGVRTAARHLGAVKYIEMETFDADKFAEQINHLLATVEPETIKK
jgi:CheY-like chemotaxis protein